MKLINHLQIIHKQHYYDCQIKYSYYGQLSLEQLAVCKIAQHGNG